jgi:flagellin-like protein
LTRTKNVRNATKFKRSIKAISPVIATLLMIAIAVVASLVAYAWVMGYMGFTTNNAGKAIAIPSFAGVANTGTPTRGGLVVYVQNVGQGTVEIGAVYVDSAIIADAALTYDPSNVISEGNTIEVTIAGPFDLTIKHDIKVTTTDGTFMTTSGKPKTGGEAVVISALTGSFTTPVGSTVNVGDTITVTLHVTKTGAASETGVTPSTLALVGTGATYLSGPFPASATIASGGSQDFTWEYTAVSAGTVTFSGSASGIAQYSGDAVSTSVGPSEVVTITSATSDKITLRPMGHGNSENLDRTPSQTGSGQHAVTVHNWANVDELSSDDDTSYVYRNDHLHYDTYAMENSGMTTKTIQQITVHIMAKVTGGSGTATEYIRTDGTDYYNPSAHTLTSAYVEYTYTWTTNPKTQTTWTWSDIDALECGVGLSQSDGIDNDAARCTQVWVEVTYTP